MIEKENTRNIPIVKYILSWKKTKWRQSDVDIGYSSGWVTYIQGVSRECNPVRIIGYFYQFFAFLIYWTWYGTYKGPRWFLNKDDVIRIICFKYNIDDKVVLANILRENFDVFQNHI